MVFLYQNKQINDPLSVLESSLFLHGQRSCKTADVLPAYITAAVSIRVLKYKFTSSFLLKSAPFPFTTLFFAFFRSVLVLALNSNLLQKIMLRQCIRSRGPVQLCAGWRKSLSNLCCLTRKPVGNEAFLHEAEGRKWGHP